MPRTTPNGTPVRALADALYAGTADHAMTYPLADDLASAAIDTLTTAGWHLTREPAGHLPAVPAGHEAVMVRMDFDAELDTLAALVKLLDGNHHGEYLEPAERARIVAVLAARYLPGAVLTLTDVRKVTATEGA